MRLVLNALALTALALPTGKGLLDRLADGVDADKPTCRAQMAGDELTTALEFPGGYTVEGPWKVVWTRAATLGDGRNGQRVGATLDRVVELGPETGERLVSAFPKPIETTFEGIDKEELVHHAAQVWCMVVLKAQGREESADSDTPIPVRIAMQQSPAAHA